MTIHEVQQQIERSISQYDEGHITRTALSAIVHELLTSLDAYRDDTGDDDDDEILFEADMDLDDLMEDQDEHDEK